MTHELEVPAVSENAKGKGNQLSASPATDSASGLDTGQLAPIQDPNRPSPNFQGKLIVALVAGLLGVVAGAVGAGFGAYLQGRNAETLWRTQVRAQYIQELFLRRLDSFEAVTRIAHESLLMQSMVDQQKVMLASKIGGDLDEWAQALADALEKKVELNQRFADQMATIAVAGKLFGPCTNAAVSAMDGGQGPWWEERALVERILRSMNNEMLHGLDPSNPTDPSDKCETQDHTTSVSGDASETD